MHGAHQVAQKFKTTPCPLKSEIVNSASWALKNGYTGDGRGGVSALKFAKPGPGLLHLSVSTLAWSGDMETITNTANANSVCNPGRELFGALFWLQGYKFMVGFDLEYFWCEVQR